MSFDNDVITFFSDFIESFIVKSPGKPDLPISAIYDGGFEDDLDQEGYSPSITAPSDVLQIVKEGCHIVREKTKKRYRVKGPIENDGDAISIARLYEF